MNDRLINVEEDARIFKGTVRRVLGEEISLLEDVFDALSKGKVGVAEGLLESVYFRLSELRKKTAR